MCRLTVMKFGKLSRWMRFLGQYGLGKPPYAAYVLGWHGHHNLGDEAVYGALKSYFGDFRFVDFPRRMPRWCMRTLSRMELGLLAGGTMISGEISGAMYTQQCFLQCPKSIVFGSGVHHPDFWIERRGAEEWNAAAAIWKKTLDRCDYVGVRGPDSAMVLADWGVKNVEVIGDPALYYADGTPPKPLRDVQPSVGLNLAQTKNLHMYGQSEVYLREFADLAKQFKKADWAVYWYVVWPDDYAPTKKIAESTGTADAIVPIYTDCHKFTADVKQRSLFVGTRLHAVALSVAAYVPSISLEYQPKCSDFMKSVGQQDRVIRIDRFNNDLVWELVLHTQRRQKEISESLYQLVQELRCRQVQRANEFEYKPSGCDAH